MKLEVVDGQDRVYKQEIVDRLARPEKRAQVRREREQAILEKRAEAQAAREDVVSDRFAALEAELADARKDITSSKGEITKLKNTIAALQKPA